MPAVSGTLSNAKQAENVAKLRMLGLGSLSYAAENGGYLPSVVRVANGTVYGSPRMTQGPALWANQYANPLSMLTNRWDSENADRDVWGQNDILGGPDSFYGPFTPNIEREPNKFAPYNSNIGRLIGYIYYSLPEDDDSTPPRNRVHPRLINEHTGSEGLPATPLFSDISTESWANLVGGYTGRNISAVHLDGSVTTYDKDYIWGLPSNDKIRAFGGVLDDD